MTKLKFYYTLMNRWFVVLFVLLGLISGANATADIIEIEPIKACVISRDIALDKTTRNQISRCIGWNQDLGNTFCRGNYTPIQIIKPNDPNEIKIKANSGSVYLDGKSELKGDVEIRQYPRVVSAQTANIYRNAKTKAITKIELIGNVRYMEPDILVYAKSVDIYPKTDSALLKDILYRFKVDRAHAALPAWGRASFIEKFANKDYLLSRATYTTCSPSDKSWEIDAEKITINSATSSGVAKKAYFKVYDKPVIYLPYMSFPATKDRKSGFLMPIYGYTNVSGFDYAFPYYFNIAPNFDATFVPHVYSFRGVMAGGNARFLTSNSTGVFGLNFLPHDALYNSFLMKNKDEFAVLRDKSSNRWSVMLKETSRFTKNLTGNINYRQVSDDYYFQDFSTNLTVASTNQILREGDLTYLYKNWTFFGMLQSYQTLHAINQSAVANVYERLPQLSARGNYYDLPLNGNLRLLGQFDNFHWNGREITIPEGPRYHFNPVLSLPHVKPWGYITPEFQVVENYYTLSSYTNIPNIVSAYTPTSFNRTIPRYSVDSGLIFKKDKSIFGKSVKETLKPRVYYLNVPYHNQSEFPSFDSAYMIFNTDQLFRNNRFSGLDRISDANQLAYAATLNFISANTGLEIADLTVGQIRYFSKRRVQLCYRPDGNCTDNSMFLGYVSPKALYSPIASKLSYALTSVWSLSSDYVWDPYTSATNNGNFTAKYQPTPNRILSLGYNYIVNGNIIDTPEDAIRNNPLNQTTFSYAWPFNDKWSSLGVYSYNVSEAYPMLMFFGLQYDSCCWAARLIGGRQFKSLGIDSITPKYNNSVFFQVLLKGLGSATSNDPASTIQTYLPGYPNIFSR